MDILKGKLSPVASMHGTLSAMPTIKGKLTVPDVVALPDYHGDFEITPGEEEQVLETTDRTLRENIVIKAIPSNYGRIGWNGATLSVF